MDKLRKKRSGKQKQKFLKMTLAMGNKIVEVKNSMDFHT
jgi:hypothetical protein